MSGQLQRSLPEEHNSFTFENNLVVWKSGPLLTGNWRNLHMTTRSNLYWNSTGEPVSFMSSRWCSGRRRGRSKAQSSPTRCS